MDTRELRFGDFKEGQENAVSDMIWEVFSEFEAPDYVERGIRVFKEFIEPQRLLNEVRNNCYKIFCCYENDTLAGVLALRSLSHISLLFVKKSHHKRGIAKELLKQAMEYILSNKPDSREITVNSSPYAVEIYKRMGFFSTADMLEKDGIIFMPMKKLLI